MIEKKETIAIIPARGGSKGVKRKNIKNLYGHPLIYYSIMFGKKSKFIDRVIVSTEDKEIAEISKKLGAEVIDRPKELATDDSPTLLTLKHVLENLEKEIHAVVLAQPTSPFRSNKTLEKMLDIYEHNKNTVITVVKKDNPRMGKLIDKKYIPLNYKMGQRRQDIQELYQENGNLYVLNPENVIKNKFFTKEINFCVIEDEERIDIDSEFDFKLAEFFMEQKK